MLTRFNLGSIPSTAKSILGLKIRWLNPIKFVMIFFPFFWIGEGQEECLDGVPFFFGKLCVTNWLAYFLQKSEWAVRGMFLVPTKVSQVSLVGQ
jgi:hypothetical protein